MADVPRPARVLVSDFDGTLARDDFYDLFRRRARPPHAAAIWADYEAGRISHFEALRRTYADAAPGEDALRELVRDLDPPPDLAAAVERLRAGGWDLVVVSAGCRWYIDQVFAAAGVDPELHACDGHVADGRLVMEWPAGDPYRSPADGIDKAGVVRAKQTAGAVVAFAGDGHADLRAALAVPPDLRFARRALSADLRHRGEAFRPFDRWTEVVGVLIS